MSNLLESELLDVVSNQCGFSEPSYFTEQQVVLATELPLLAHVCLSESKLI